MTSDKAWNLMTMLLRKELWGNDPMRQSFSIFDQSSPFVVVLQDFPAVLGSHEPFQLLLNHTSPPLVEVQVSYVQYHEVIPVVSFLPDLAFLAVNEAAAVRTHSFDVFDSNEPPFSCSNTSILWWLL